MSVALVSRLRWLLKHTWAVNRRCLVSDSRITCWHWSALVSINCCFTLLKIIDDLGEHLESPGRKVLTLTETGPSWKWDTDNVREVRGEPKTLENNRARLQSYAVAAGRNESEIPACEQHPAQQRKPFKTTYWKRHWSAWYARVDGRTRVPYPTGKSWIPQISNFAAAGRTRTIARATIPESVPRLRLLTWFAQLASAR